MGPCEHWLTLWAALPMLAGLVPGNLAPGAFQALAALEYASVNRVLAALTWAWQLPHSIAAPCAPICASNPFERFVTVAVGLFGLNSVAALVTVGDVQVEAPVMLCLAALAIRTRDRLLS